MGESPLDLSPSLSSSTFTQVPEDSLEPLSLRLFICTVGKFQLPSELRQFKRDELN